MTKLQFRMVNKVELSLQPRRTLTTTSLALAMWSSKVKSELTIPIAVLQNLFGLDTEHLETCQALLSKKRQPGHVTLLVPTAIIIVTGYPFRVLIFQLRLNTPSFMYQGSSYTQLTLSRAPTIPASPHHAYHYNHPPFHKREM